MAEEMARQWKLLHCLKDDTDKNSALLILNMPLKPHLQLLRCLWKKAVMKAAADGGSNRLYDVLESSERGNYVPDLITGDFDSARPEVLDFYKSKGSAIVRTEDQNYTDFTKCLKTLADRLEGKQIDYIFVLGAFGGRQDQVFANLNTLYTAQDLFKNSQVYLLSNHSSACLLPPGSHVLQVDSGLEGDWCGLIPLGGACECVKTTGLKWNLDGQRLKFGELISTSNTWDGSASVTVATDGPLIWTMGVSFTDESNKDDEF